MKKAYHALNAVVVVALVLMSAGCFRTAGGGSVGEINPDQTDCHRPIKVGITCKLYDGRKASKANHRDVRLYYVRTSNENPTVVKSDETIDTKEGVSFFATIPPVESSDDCVAIEYWFEFTVDGFLNTSRRVVIPAM